MKKILFASFAVFFGYMAKAQNGFSFNCTRDTVISCTQNCITLTGYIPNIRSLTDDYDVSSLNSGFCRIQPPSSTVQGSPSNISQDDRYTQIIPMPFDFPFYGIFYSQLVASSNGIISFDVANALGFSHYGILSTGTGLSAIGGTPQNLPNTRYDRAIIMGPYHDIDISANTSLNKKIYYQVDGVAPYRRWILAFYEIPLFSGACNPLYRNTHQIILYESTGIIDVFVYDKQICLGWNEGRAMIGLQNYDRDKGIMVPGRRASDAPWGAVGMNEAWRFTPKAGPSLFKSVELLDLSGSVLATGDTTSISNSVFAVNFPNVCPPNTGTYVIRSTYSKIDDPSVDIYGYDTVSIIKNTSVPPITSTTTAAPCGINTTGTITVTAPLGANFEYSIDNGTTYQSSPVFTVPPGTYTIKVRDISGNCFNTATATVGTLTTLTATANVTNTTCPGASNGIIEVNASLGAGGYTYAVDGGGSPVYVSGNTFNNLDAGTHTVYVKDNIGCVFIFNVDVNSDPGFTTTATSTDASCLGISNGTITVTQPSSGTAPFKYYIPGTIAPQLSPVMTGLAGATNYNVVVEDAVGCSYNFTQAVGYGIGATASFTSVNASCAGVSNGKIAITPTAGASPFYYSTDGGATFQLVDTIRNLAGGSYNIIIKDAIGCTFNAPPVAVNNDPGVIATFTTINTSCTGVNNGKIAIDVTTGNSPYQYSLNGGVTYTALDTIRNLGAGTYNVVVKDAVGCTTASLPLVVTDGPGISAAFTAYNTSCAGVNNGKIAINPSAGVGPYYYSMDGGTTYNLVDTIRNLAAGPYNIRVKDAVGCIYDGSATVVNGAGITSTFTTVNASCTGVSNGKIAIIPASGVGPYSYSLDGGATYNLVDTIRNLAAGPYNIRVKDAVGCTFDGTATVSNGAGITSTFTTVNASCTGVSNGKIAIIPASGVGPYSYSLDGGATYNLVDTIRNLAAGPYNIRVKDAVGCTFDGTATVNNGSGITATFTSINASCSGVSNGKIAINPASGIAPYYYSLDGGATYQLVDTIRNLASGSYTIKVKDAVGCTFDGTATVNNSAGVAATFTTVSTACSAASTGRIITTITSGNAPYSYSLNGGATYAALDTIRNLAEGPYNIRIRDNAGCVFDGTATVSANNPGVAATFTTVNSACTGVSTGRIIITPTQGVSPFSYSLDAGATYTALDTIRNLASGSYNIRFKDALGCAYDAPAVTVNNDAGVAATFTTVSTACSAASTGRIITTITSGNAPYSYSLNGGATYAALDTIRNLAEGPYNIRIRDNAGCVFNGTATVSANNPGVAATFTTVNSACTGVSTGRIIITPTQGVSPFSYSLNAGATYTALDTIRNLASGSYNIRFKDALGCAYDAPAVTVNNDAGVAATFTTVSTACSAASTGRIITTITSGNAPYSYSLNGGATYAALDTIRNLAEGPYNIRIRDNAGCVFNGTATVNANNPGVAATFTTVNSACTGVSTGRIIITPTQGVSPFSYSLNAGATYTALDTIRNLASGSYNIRFKDALGCAYDAPPVTVSDDIGVTASFSSVNAACTGAATGAIIVTAQTGSPAFRYSIDGGGTYQTNNVFRKLLAGSYSIRIVDAVGCVYNSPAQSVSNNVGVQTSPAVIQNASCASIPNGGITVNTTAGIAPFTYLLASVPGALPQSANNFTGLFSGPYTVLVTDSAGCTLNVSANVGNNPKVKFDGLTIVRPSCNGLSDGTVTPAVSLGVSPYSYAIDAGTFGNNPVFTGIAAGSHIVYVKDANGCQIDSSFTVTQPAVLTGAVVSTTPATCSGNPDGKIVVSGNGGTTPYQYTIDQTGLVGYQASSSFDVLKGTYTVTIQDAKGCKTPVTGTVDSVFTMFLDLGRDTTVCSGQSIVLRPSTNAETTVFTYSPAGSLDNATTKNPSASPLQPTRYTLTAKWGICTLTDSIFIDVLRRPVAHAGNDVTICYGATTVLRGSATNLSGTVNYSWSPSTMVSKADTVETTAAPVPARKDQATVTDFTLTVTDNYGCNFSETDVVKVTMLADPAPYAGNDTNAVYGIPHQLTGIGAGAGGSYFWELVQPVNGSALFSNRNSATPTVVFQPMGNPQGITYDSNYYRIALKTLDAAACPGYDTITIHIYRGPTYYVPNAFSPNNDGLNDIFRPIPVGVTNTEYFRIFNRYGQVVYETTRFMEGWDGTFKGQPQPGGAYVWLLKGKDRNGKLIELKGSVMLVR